MYELRSTTSLKEDQREISGVHVSALRGSRPNFSEIPESSLEVVLLCSLLSQPQFLTRNNNSTDVMPSVNSLTRSVGLRVGPIVLETLVKHYLEKIKRDFVQLNTNKDEEKQELVQLRQDELMYDEIFTIVKASCSVYDPEYASQYGGNGKTGVSRGSQLVSSLAL